VTLRGGRTHYGIPNLAITPRKMAIAGHVLPAIAYLAWTVVVTGFDHHTGPYRITLRDG